MSIIADALKKAQEERVLEKIFSSAPPSVKHGLKGQKPSRLTLAVIFIFLISVIGSVSYLIFFKPGAGTFETTPIPEQTIMPGPAIVTAVKTVSPDVIEPAPEHTAGPKLPVLSGIMHSPSHPQAIMDGILYSQGDRVGDFHILNIFPNKVIISSSGKEYELKLR
jgi:hypothetical protein